jgi:Phosphotransferase enzyme family
MHLLEELREVAESFDIKGELLSINTHKSGLINQSYISTWSHKGGNRRYIHQKINHQVFPNVEGLMSNILAITRHLKNKNNFPGVVPEIIYSKTSRAFIKDSSNHYWRTYLFIEQTRSIDVCNSPEIAYEAAQILGAFQNALYDFDADKLVEIIPNFQSTPYRYIQLEEAIKADKQGRVRICEKEIEFALLNKNFGSIIDKHLKAGEISLRVTHGDMKLNNVLFDEQTNKAVSIVDLDTCMKGYSLYDFADLARNTCVQAEEDEQDFSKISVNVQYFSALVKAYLSQTKSILNVVEKSLLVKVPRLLALTLGVRFLTDYINGDKYFRITRSQQNIERARTQFKIVEAFEQAKLG